jgi:phosphoserine phosphatase
MIAALFDIEGTLFTSPMGRGFVKYASAHGRRLQALAYFASFMPPFFLSKLGLLSREAINTAAVARMPRLIQGYDLRQADSAFEWIVDGFILPSGRTHLLELWERHRRAGHLLIIASGGLTPCVERIGARLGAGGTVGTEVEVCGGRYSGRIASPVVIGPEKATRTMRLIEQLGADVDWPSSSAYADSFHDLPFLELAGHPTAVYPDAKLARVAAERGWPVVEGE